jgi:phospholipid N-methyltransferase
MAKDDETTQRDAQVKQDMTQDTTLGWSEINSATFLDVADIFVPQRDEQLRTLVALIPAAPQETFTVVELGAGSGVLARAILEAFPHSSYLALDGSALMRERLVDTLAPFGPRVEARDFDLDATDWRMTLPEGLRCVVSSLTIHHLVADAKRRLYTDLAARLVSGGALLIADLVQPGVPHAAALFARQWNDAVRAQSLALRGNLSGYERFQSEQWNNFALDPDGADEIDHPSRLFEQLQWLRDAGFARVDCFWMSAGHAIFGGYR